MSTRGSICEYEEKYLRVQGEVLVSTRRIACEYMGK